MAGQRSHAYRRTGGKDGRKKQGIGAQLEALMARRRRACFGCGLAGLAALAVQITVVEVMATGVAGSDGVVSGLKIVGSLLTCVAVLYLAQYYQLAYSVACKTMELMEGDTVVSSGYALQFLVEFAILLPHSPPGVDFTVGSVALSVQNPAQGWQSIEYSSEAVVCLLMFVRVYWVWKFAREYAGLNSETSRSVAVWYEEEITAAFVTRTLMIRYPLRVVVGTTVLTLGVFAYVVCLLERPADEAFDDFSAGLWLVIITMTTVGYGDIYPHSAAGRLVVSLLCVLSLAELAMIVSLTAQALQVSMRQQKVLHLLDHSTLHAELKNRACQSIAEAWRASLECSRKGEGTVEDSTRLSVTLRNFRALRKRLSVPLDQGTELLFKEMLTLREHSDIMLHNMIERMDAIEKAMTGMGGELDLKMLALKEQMAKTIQVVQGVN